VAIVADGSTNTTANRRAWLKARENYMKFFTATRDDSNQEADTASLVSGRSYGSCVESRSSRGCGSCGEFCSLGAGHYACQFRAARTAYCGTDDCAG
jgi:hypothetical protein